MVGRRSDGLDGDRAEDGGKLKALFKISRLSGPVWGGGGGETRGGRSA